MNNNILLVGNPNVGKSTVFNALCNTKQKTGNYAGVTVSSHSGEYVYNGKPFTVTDLLEHTASIHRLKMKRFLVIIF